MANEANSEITFWELVERYSIKIPMIQRDYAQGRQEGRVPFIRDAFLKSLYHAVATETPLKLDFIYGRIESVDDGQKELIPIDGQQRLTTLFLLHFYGALQAGALSAGSEARNRLKRFTYHTRRNSADFCHALVMECSEPFATPPPSTYVIDQPWFFASWQRDPTVKAMLVMLDAIHAEFADISPQLYNILTDSSSRVVTFEFETFEKLNLDDEMYIKMNSRGKPLNDFESFKARFEKFLEDRHGHQARTDFAERIDGKEWTDLFWQRGQEASFDKRFSAFFMYVTEILYHKSFGSMHDGVLGFEPNASDPDFWKPYYQAKESVDHLLEYVDLLVSMGTPRDFFTVRFSDRGSDDSRLPLFDTNPDPFEHVVEGGRTDIQWKILLYFVLEYVRRKGLPKQDNVDFLERARTLRNLVNRVRYLRWPTYDSNLRSEELGEYFSSVDSLLSLPSPFYQSFQEIKELRGFTQTSLGLEQRKARLYCDNPSLQPYIFQMEDRDEFRGSIQALLETNDPTEISRAFETFKEVWDGDLEPGEMLVTRALIASGFEGNSLGGWSKIGDRRFFGGDSKHRHTLLSFVGVNEYRIGKHLVPFLRKVREIRATKETMQATLEEIVKNGIEDFVNRDPRPWQYYALTYPDGFWGNRQHLFAFRSDYEIERLAKTTAGSKHISPYVATAISKIGNSDICCKADSPTYGRDPSAIVVKSGGRIVARVYSDKAGWRVLLENTDPIPQVFSALKSVQNNEKTFLLPISGIEDRIDKVVSFVWSLIGEVENGEAEGGAVAHLFV